MSEFYDWINIILFALLIFTTIVIGNKNHKHLTKIFNQSQIRDTVELRPIIIVKFMGNEYFTVDGTEINISSLDQYYQKYNPKSLLVKIHFNIINNGKMVAQNLTSKFTINNKDDPSIYNNKTKIDLAPTDNQNNTFTAIRHDSNPFIIKVDYTWEYGENKKGKTTQTIKILPIKTDVLFEKKETNLDWKN